MSSVEQPSSRVGRLPLRIKLLENALGQFYLNFATATFGAFLEHQRASMSFNNLPAQGQANACAGCFRSVKRHKQIFRFREPLAFITDPDFYILIMYFPR